MENDEFEVDESIYDKATTPGTFEEDPADISRSTIRFGAEPEVGGTYPLGIKQSDALERPYTRKYWHWEPEAAFEYVAGTLQAYR